MHSERLQLMATLMDEVQADEDLLEHFSLDHWTEGVRLPSTQGPNSNPKDYKYKVVNSCGTTACACGFAGLDSRFREQGFLLTVGGTPVFSVHASGWNSIATFFDVDRQVALRLFQPQFYALPPASPADVAYRIRTLLRKGGMVLSDYPYLGQDIDNLDSLDDIVY